MKLTDKTNFLSRLTAVFLLVMTSFPLFSQEEMAEPDTVVTFRFFPGRNEFYAPGLNNGAELARLFDYVERDKGKITGHEIFLKVNGYSNSRNTEAKNKKLARIRSNRVKAELITRKGLTEDCFITRNHAGNGDYVTVSVFLTNPILPLPADENIPEEQTAETAVEQESETVDAVADTLVSEDVEVSELTDADYKQFVITCKGPSGSDFALKTNMLYYAVLMPNIQVEWKFAQKWSAALEVQGAWYAKEEPHKVYRLSTVIPEMRYWVINRSKWHGMYVGAFGGGGLYDLCNGRKGHEGEGFLAGVSAGYMWPISKHLSLDAGIGVGYLHVRDKEYLPVDGHYLYQLTKNVNYVGPLRLNLSLVWRIPRM